MYEKLTKKKKNEIYVNYILTKLTFTEVTKVNLVNGQFLAVGVG